MNIYYYMIEKKDIINGELVNTPVGYVNSVDDIILLNAGKYKEFNDWIKLNLVGLQSGVINISSYFITNPPFYFSEWKSTSIDGLNLDLITDINILI